LHHSGKNAALFSGKTHYDLGKHRSLPMYLPNSLPFHNSPLDPRDAETLGIAGADSVARMLATRQGSAPTPLRALPGLAGELGLASVHLKDEGHRLGLGSFKALGGAYALMRLVQDAASLRIGRAVPPEALHSPEVRAIAATMTFACATDGNHGRSVAQGAQLMGARAVIFVHSGVSQGRIDAIARFGAKIVRVAGNYDTSVAEAARVAAENAWVVLSDTSWPGYEHIPGLVMQGYTAIVREALTALPEPPTHVFLQAGVGGFAAAIAGHLAVLLGNRRPHVTVVDPARAACLYASAQAGHVVKVPETEPTVMAMLECYEPSLVAFRVLSRVADGFMTVDEDDALSVMRRLALPVAGDPAVIAGESGAVGLAGAIAVLRDRVLATSIGLGPKARLLVINTEGATDPGLYAKIIGRTPEAVLEGAVG
jgi:diaminopropionate ammonia-lyase